MKTIIGIVSVVVVAAAIGYFVFNEKNVDIFLEKQIQPSDNALDGSSIDIEASNADLNRELTDMQEDETALQELDQAFNEVAQ